MLTQEGEFKLIIALLVATVALVIFLGFFMACSDVTHSLSACPCHPKSAALRRPWDCVRACRTIELLPIF